MTAQDRVEAAERERHGRDRRRDVARSPASESVLAEPVREEETPAVGRGAHDAAAVAVHAAGSTPTGGAPPLDAVARWQARSGRDHGADGRSDDPSSTRPVRATPDPRRSGAAATSTRAEARRSGARTETVPSSAPAAAALTVTAHGDAREAVARRTAELAGQSGRGPPAVRDPNPHAGRGPPVVAPEQAPPRTLAAARPGTDRVPSAVRVLVRAPGAGSPVSDGVREQVEPLVGADLSAVRVHADRRSADAAEALGARAFTVGSDVFLGAGQSSTDVRLMAHELTHTVQQSRASPDTIFRDGDATSYIPDSVLDAIAAQADSLPGYVLMTQLVEYDPIRARHVERSVEGVVRGLFGLVPFGVQIYDRLAASDLVQRAMALVTDGLTTHRLTLARLRHEVDAAWAELPVMGLPSESVAVVVRHIDGIVSDVTAFARSLVDQVIALVREVAVGMLEHLLDGPTVGPAWSLAKKVMHHDPLRDVDVVASTEEILSDLLTLLGQGDRLAQLRERGVITQVATWIDANIGRFQGLVTELGGLFHEAWNAIAPANLADLPHNLEALVAHAGDLLGRVRSFGEELIDQALSLVKDSLLHWLSEHAHQTRGFRLVTVLIGQDPFTHEAVPPTPENLIGGFISLLPNGEATFAQLSESGVIADASARITTAAAELGITSQLVRDTFLGIWDSLHLEDLLHPIDTFVRIVDAFGDPVRRIIAFVATVVQVVIELVLRLMNFPSDLLASIIEHVTSAIAAIREDPVRFLMNMLEALKRGILSFVDHIATHLLDGLASWLFRGLGQLGIQRPPDLSLQSIISLVLQVLGLSMDLVWAKLEERLGAETVGRIRGALDMLSGAWGFIKDVQERGITAIWEFISGQLSNLWDTIISAAQAWIQDRIVSAVVEKLVSMLDPTGVMAVVNSFLAFFRAVQSLIDYLREVLELVNEYVTTLDEVAHGNVDPAATKVENGLAMATPMAIGFLANQVGIGNIPEKIVEIITSVRGVVEQAVAWLIDQAITLGQSALAALGVGTQQDGDGSSADVLAAALAEVTRLAGGDPEESTLRAQLPAVLAQLSGQGLHSLDLRRQADGQLLLVGSASPETVLADLAPAQVRPQMHCRARVVFDPDPGHGPQHIGSVEPGVQTSREGEAFMFMPSAHSGGSAVSPRARGGAVFVPAGTDSVEAVTWNSSHDLRRGSNTDHAEHHLARWLTSLHGRRSLVREISVVNDPYSPCTLCADELEGEAREIADSRSSASRGPLHATLQWSRPWTGLNQTLPRTIPSMNHWSVTPNQLPATGDHDYDAQLSLHVQYRAQRDASAARPRGTGVTVRRAASAPAR